NTGFEKQRTGFERSAEKVVDHGLIVGVNHLHAILAGPQSVFFNAHDFLMTVRSDDPTRSDIHVPGTELSRIDGKVKSVDTFFQDLLRSLFSGDIDQNIDRTLEFANRIKEGARTRQ